MPITTYLDSELVAYYKTQRSLTQDRVDELSAAHDDFDVSPRVRFEACQGHHHTSAASAH